MKSSRVLSDPLSELLGRQLQHHAGGVNPVQLFQRTHAGAGQDVANGFFHRDSRPLVGSMAKVVDA